MRTLSVGGIPGTIALSPGRVWVADRREGGVVGIDRARMRVVVRSPPTGGRAEGVAASRQAVFVALHTDGGDVRVVRVDPATGRPRSPAVRVPGGGDDALPLVADGSDALLGTTRGLSVVGGRPFRLLGTQHVSAAEDATSDLTGETPAPSVLALDDPRSARGIWAAYYTKTARIEFADRSETSVRGGKSLAVAGRRIYVADVYADAVIAYDARTGEERARRKLPWEPDELAASPGAVWAASSDPAELLRLDPETLAPQGGPIHLGTTADLALASDAGGVWIAAAEGKLLRVTP